MERQKQNRLERLRRLALDEAGSQSSLKWNKRGSKKKEEKTESE